MTGVLLTYFYCAVCTSCINAGFHQILSETCDLRVTVSLGPLFHLLSCVYHPHGDCTNLRGRHNLRYKKYMYI